MTLIIGAVAANFSIIGADRRVQVGASLAGPFTPGDADKLFEVDQCSAASFGSNPPAVDVPVFVRQFAGRLLEPSSLARALFQQVKALPDPGNFGLLVAGSGAKEPELWEVTKRGQDCVKLAPNILHERENVVGVQGEAALPDADSMRKRVLEVLRQGCLRHPLWVGPPYEISLIRYGQAPIITRYMS